VPRCSDQIEILGHERIEDARLRLNDGADLRRVVLADAAKQRRNPDGTKTNIGCPI